MPLRSKSSDTVIVDVREKDEWDEEHILNAVHMSRGMVELEVEDKFPDRNMTIICHWAAAAVPRSRRKFAKDGL